MLIGSNLPILNYNIKRLRKEIKMTQNDLAAELERRGYPITLKTLRGYEKAVNAIPSDILIALSEIFGCSCDYLLGRSECRSVDNDLIYQTVGLSDDSINRLKEYHGSTIVDALNDLIPRIGSGGSDADLLTLMTAYLYRPDGSDVGDAYILGEKGKDIFLSGEILTSGGLLQNISAKLAEYRKEIQSKHSQHKK